MQRYNTAVLEYRGANDTNATGPLSGNVVMTNTLNLDSSKRILIKPISAMLSTRIPNIYKYGIFDNTVIRVRRNVADAWTVITLDDGVYVEVSQIQAALMSIIGGWMTNINDPALLFAANTVTDKVYITINTSKLSAGTQMCVDLSQSRIAWTLGFPDLTTYNADGVYASTLSVNVDAQGVICDVQMSLCQCRYVNGRSQRILFSVPLTLLSSSFTEYLYPPFGQVVPLIQYSGSNSINTYSINFRTYLGDEMVWLKGSRCEVIFELQQEL